MEKIYTTIVSNKEKPDSLQNETERAKAKTALEVKYERFKKRYNL